MITIEKIEKAVSDEKRKEYRRLRNEGYTADEAREIAENKPRKRPGVFLK